jgi:hypothetical protein
MARLYVVAFSKPHRRVRHLANPLRCVYNADSPLGAPPLGSIPHRSSSVRFENDLRFISGHKVIFEHEDFQGQVPSQPW